MVVAFGVSPGTKVGEAGSAGVGLHRERQRRDLLVMWM